MEKIWTRSEAVGYGLASVGTFVVFHLVKHASEAVCVIFSVIFLATAFLACKALGEILYEKWNSEKQEKTN